MKRFFLLNYTIFILANVLGQGKIEGTYIGLEKLCWTLSKEGKCINTDNINPNRKWYHENILKVKNDSVFLDQNPISIFKKDTSYSASDGAFYYYCGTIKKFDTTFQINLTEIFCDYCGELVEKQADSTYKRIMRTKQLFGRFTKNGIIIDNFLYKKSNDFKFMISEHPNEFLKNN